MAFLNLKAAFTSVNKHHQFLLAREARPSELLITIKNIYKEGRERVGIM